MLRPPWLRNVTTFVSSFWLRFISSVRTLQRFCFSLLQVRAHPDIQYTEHTKFFTENTEPQDKDLLIRTPFFGFAERQATLRCHKEHKRLVDILNKTLGLCADVIVACPPPPPPHLTPPLSSSPSPSPRPSPLLSSYPEMLILCCCFIIRCLFVCYLYLSVHIPRVLMAVCICYSL